MNMKRFVAMLLALTMLLAMGACGAKETTVETTPTPAPTPAPTPEPEWEAGVIRAGYLGGVLTHYQRGDEVTVLGVWEDFFIIEGEETRLLVENQFLRPETEEAPAEEPGYTYGGTGFYATGYLRGEALQTLKLNTKVTVLDKKGDWALIRLEDGTEGYVDASKLSRWYINSYAGGGSSGGSSSSGAQDGTDVNLGNIAAVVTEHQANFLEEYQGDKYELYDTPVKGMILSAETEAYAVMFVRDEEVKVTEVTEATDDAEATCTIWVDDLFVTVPRWAVWMEGDDMYQPWSAYGRWGGVAYTEIQQWYELISISTNQRIEVVDELTEIGMYVIEVDGVYGYVELAKLSTYRYTAPSGGSSSGGGGGSSSGWTAPVM